MHTWLGTSTLILASMLGYGCDSNREQSSERVTSYRNSEKNQQKAPASATPNPKKRSVTQHKPSTDPSPATKDAGPTDHLKEHLERLDHAASEQEQELERLSGDLPSSP